MCIRDRITTVEVVNIIKKRLDYLREQGKYDIIFVDAPLLFETGADKLTDYVWLVDANLETRISRVMERDRASREAVRHRIENQMGSEEKKKLSQEIIDNSKGKEDVYKRQVITSTRSEGKTFAKRKRKPSWASMLDRPPQRRL